MTDRHTAVIAYAQAAKETRFAPGRHDCALFAAGWVRACGGPDLAKGYRSQYRSLAKGQAMLEAQGFADHVALAAAHLREVPRLMAQSGDVALIEIGAETGFGLVAGEIIYCLRREGLGHVPLTAAKRVFRP